MYWLYFKILLEMHFETVWQSHWKCYNATLVYSLNVGNELEACIIYLRRRSYVYRWVETVVTEMNQFTCMKSGYEIALSQNLKRLFVQNLPNKNKQSDVCHWSIWWCFNVHCIMQVAFSSRRWNVSTIHSFSTIDMMWCDANMQHWQLDSTKKCHSLGLIVVCGRQTHELTHVLHSKCEWMQALHSTIRWRSLERQYHCGSVCHSLFYCGNFQP